MIMMDGLPHTAGPLDRVAEIPVLGIPVRFESNDRTIMEVVEDSFGGWRAVADRPDLVAAEGVRVRLIAHRGDEGAAEHAQFSYAMPSYERVVVSTAGSLGLADAGAREVVAYVTETLVADREHFRYGLVEAMTLALLTRFDRLPLHAAALVREDQALLLAGPSGVGKSTLAYAAATDGLLVMSEDVVYVQRQPRIRVWGMPGHIHLAPDAGRHFPELAGTHPRLLANGKRKIAVETASLRCDVALPVVERAGLCVVTRGEGEVGVSSLSAEDVVDELTAYTEAGFDAFADSLGDCLRRLAGAGGWRLRAAGPPRSVVPLLHELFDRLGAER